MKKSLPFFLSFILFAIAANSQVLMHVMNSNEAAIKAGSTNIMTKRIIDAATQYEKYAPVPRLALYDCAFATDLQEYTQLGGIGILLVSSLNQDLTEYPIKRVYIKKKDGITVDLKLIGDLKVDVSDKPNSESLWK